MIKSVVLTAASLNMINETICGLYSSPTIVSVVKLGKLITIGWTYRKKLNATEYWWENLQIANLENYD